MRYNAVKLGMALLLPLLITGCSVGRFVRIEQNRGMYETWPSDMQKAVSSGNILKGMTSDMVQIAWGKAAESSTDPSGTFMYWLYPVGDIPAVRMEAFPKEEGVARPPGPVEIEVSRGEPASTSMVVFQYGQVVRVEKVRRRR